MRGTVLRTTGQSRFTSGAATRNRQRSESFYRSLFASASATAGTEAIVRRAMSRR